MAAEGGKVAGLRALAAFAPVPPFVAFPAADLGDVAAILAAADAQGVHPPYAVRSSADVEDGQAGAFAGMFETRLGVGGAELLEAIGEVAASISSERLDAYIEARGNDIAQPTGMHVIVQSMVDSRVSGVCLSRLPEDERGDARVEAVFGLGELLVSGTVEPDTYKVARADRSFEVTRVGNQVLQLTLAEGEQLVPASLRQAMKLSAEEAVAIAELAFEVERRMGWAAADIEWALEGEKLWALQARPVASMVTGEPA
jgi:pyruvate,water dikinase